MPRPSILIATTIALLLSLTPRPAHATPLNPTTSYEDLTLPEAATLPRLYIAQDATGTGDSLADPAPMGLLNLDGQDRAVVIVGNSDLRTRFQISFSERPERFALIHASALHPSVPANQFRSGSVRVDQRTWTMPQDPALLGVYKTDVSDIIDAIEANYPDPREIATPGVVYNDPPALELPDPQTPRTIIAPSIGAAPLGISDTPPGFLPDQVAAVRIGPALPGTSVVIQHEGDHFLYIKPADEITIPGTPNWPRLDLLVTDGTDQNSALITIGDTQQPSGNFPKRFLAYGVNLAHLASGSGTDRGWRGLVCQGGYNSNVRFENFTDWLCGSQDVRGSLNIAGPGSKLSFIDARALSPGTDEGHKLHANVNFADGLLVGLDTSSNWRVVSPPIRTFQGVNAIDWIFNTVKVHAQSHQGYDDGYRVSRARFTAATTDDTSTFAGPDTGDQPPSDIFNPDDYPTLFKDTDVQNFLATPRNHARVRTVHAITDATITSPSPFNRATTSIRAETFLVRDSVIVLAPTQTDDETADVFTIDGRFFDSFADPTRIDIVLDHVLIIAKENRQNGVTLGETNLFRIVEKNQLPFKPTTVRVWTRNCVILSDLPEMRLVANNTDTPITFLRFDGSPGFDAWIDLSPTSPITGYSPIFAFTDGFGNFLSKTSFEDQVGPVPNYLLDTGITLPNAAAPPQLPIDVPPQAPIRTAPLSTPRDDAPGRALAPGFSPFDAVALTGPSRTFGPFGFADIVPPSGFDDPDDNIDCLADIDRDGVVGLSDLLTILATFGDEANNGPAQGDLNTSGEVGLDDLLAVLTVFGISCEGNGTLP